MYNLRANASKFKIGRPVRVASGSGLDSNKKAIVCNHFSNDDGYEMRLRSKGWVPIRFAFDDGQVETYMAPNRLIVLNG